MSFRNFSFGNLTGSSLLISNVFGVAESERGGIDMFEELAIIILKGLLGFLEAEQIASSIISDRTLGIKRLVTAFSAVLKMVST
jgi:hypothetical protein